LFGAFRKGELMEPLQVVCYSDGRPGHEKQSQAVLAALAQITPICVVKIRLGQTAGVKRMLLGIKSLLASPMNDATPLPDVIDLIIGTGSSTHMPMVGLKIRTGAKLVTCMTPDLLLRPRFDLCLVPRHDRPPNRPGFFSTFGPPCLIPGPAIDRDFHKGLILAGGVDAKSHYWDSSYFMSQINGLISTAPDTTWTLSSSPRTPSDAIEKLRYLAKSHDNVFFFSADETPSGWIEAAYASHSQVWVTADSVSMVYEALTAGCRVGVLPVKWKKPNNKFQNGIDDLKKHGMIVDFHQWKNGEQLPMTSTPLNEAARCAEEILKQWWPERLV
jgi:mitochondrial fission protein ELM1